MKKEKDFQNSKQNLKEYKEEHKEIEQFLSQINSNRNEILKSDNQKYSILSSIFNCFYEHKALSLPKQTIFDYVRQDAIKNKGRMIVSFVINGTNSMQIIDENNYIKKTSNILSKNRCLAIDINNNISIDMDFINAHTNLINRNLFGNNGKIFNSSIELTKIKKPKTARKVNNLKKENTKANLEAGYLSQDDYEIEILESEQDETDNTELKKDNLISSNDNIIINSTPKFHKKYLSPNINKSKIINDDDNDNDAINISKGEEKLFLRKKRNRNKNPVKIKIREKANDIKEETVYGKNNEILDFQNSSNSSIFLKAKKEKKKKNKGKGNVGKDLLSFIDDGKLFLSLIQDKELINKLENEKNDLDERDSFIKSVLLNFQNVNNFKNYLNVLDEDCSEFQKSLKSLINYKSSISDGNSKNKILEKFSILNKIIFGKEKCCLLIDKIVNKLKQIILEYDFIKKVLKNSDKNKSEFFHKLKEFNFGDLKENENYVNEVKIQLTEELQKALTINNEE